MSTESQIAIWIDLFETRYTYYVHPMEAEFPAVPGNYIFARLDNGLWRAIYIGQADDFSTRFDGHHKLPCILRNGATHIHVRANYRGPDDRHIEELNLIARNHPLCND